MLWKQVSWLGLVAVLVGPAAAQAQPPSARGPRTPSDPWIGRVQSGAPAVPAAELPVPEAAAPEAAAPEATAPEATAPEAPAPGAAAPEAPAPGAPPAGMLIPSRMEEDAAEAAAPAPPSLGPAAVDSVKFLSRTFFGDVEKPPLKIYGWIELDYTARTSGPGATFVAPVMNRFGNEFLFRQLAFRIEKPLDPKNWSWGFNAQPYGGSDPAFLNPTAGAIIDNPNPRFGFDFSDLNVTAHLPILTEGGVDIKAGRQTTVIGSQAAQSPWRVFASSDYQWFLAEEGRYTGVSSTWYVNKRLSLHNGIEFGWGTFFSRLSVSPTYIGQVNYWLQDEKKTLLTGTVLTGPQRPQDNDNTTVVELRITQNWNRNFYQILQSHLGYSGAPIFAPKPPGYQQRFYAVWLINGWHLNEKWDFNTRFEWYRDVDGGGYPGGSGFRNNYFEVTVGLNYHPVNWLEFRPEIRGDFADLTPAFGAFDDPHKDKNQMTATFNMVIKY